MLENGQTGTGEPQHTEQQGRHHPHLVMTTDLAFYNLLDEAMVNGGFGASAAAQWCWDTEGSLQVSLFSCHNMRNTLIS